MADLSYSEPVNELAAKLGSDKGQLKTSSGYYEATTRPQSIGIAVPDAMKVLTAAIGWPRLYVDSIEERLDLEAFRLPDKPARIQRLSEFWEANQLDEESGLAHLDAMILGRSYVTIAAPGEADDPDIPLIRVESPTDLFADTDPRTRLVTRALRLYEDPQHKEVQWATLYLPDRTVPLKSHGGRWVVDGEIVVHNLGIVPVVPIINRERLSDRHGSSEITPEIRSFTDAGARIMMDMQAAAELMAVPQRVLFGVDASSIAPNQSKAEVMSAYMAQILAVPSDQGSAQQFQAAELRNFVEVLEELSKHVAAYTGLPPQYLSFSSENPASAEAIRSSESRLVKKCERKCRMFGGSWESVMRIAMLVMDGEIDTGMNRLKAVWRDPSTPTFAAKADAVTKLYNGGQGIIPKQRARVDMEYTEPEIEEMRKWDLEDQSELRKLSDILNPPQPEPEPSAA